MGSPTDFDVDACTAARIRRDLAEACLDADQHGLQVRAILGDAMPSRVALAGGHPLELLVRQLVLLLGSLEVARNSRKRLDDMGVEP